MDIVDKINAYETGQLTKSEIFEFFQELLDTGMIYSLQGSYQRVAEDLLLAEKIHLPKHRF